MNKNSEPFFLELRQISAHINSRNQLYKPTYKDVELHKTMNPLHPYNRERYLNLVMKCEGLDNPKFIGGLACPARPVGLIAVVFNEPYNKHIRMNFYHGEPERNNYVFHANGNEVTVPLTENIEILRAIINEFIVNY